MNNGLLRTIFQNSYYYKTVRLIIFLTLEDELKKLTVFWFVFLLVNETEVNKNVNSTQIVCLDILYEYVSL